MDLVPDRTYDITRDGETRQGKYVGQVYQGYEGNMAPWDLYVFVIDGQHEVAKAAEIGALDMNR